MHRIDVPSATPDNKFTDGSPAGGVAATTVPADWLNDLQENICKAIEGASITLAKGNSNQLLQAIQAIAGSGFLSQIGNGNFASNGWMKIPVRDSVSGVKRELILQFMLVGPVPSGGAAYTFPMTYPNAALRTIGCHESPSGPLAVSVSPLSASQVQVAVGAGSSFASILSLGY